MIVNIPFNFDEEAIENKISENVEKELIDEIRRRVYKSLADASWDNSSVKGMEQFIKDVIRNDINDNYKDLIIEKAAERLAINLSKTKKAKAIKEDQNG